MIAKPLIAEPKSYHPIRLKSHRANLTMKARWFNNGKNEEKLLERLGYLSFKTTSKHLGFLMITANVIMDFFIGNYGLLLLGILDESYGFRQH